MEITYKKLNNKLLFDNLEKEELLNVTKIQNYIPLYKKFFDLNDSNYNNINLNNNLFLVDVVNKENDNKFIGKVNSDKGNIKEKKIYFN